MYKGGYEERMSVQTDMEESDGDSVYSDVEMSKLAKVVEKLTDVEMNKMAKVVDILSVKTSRVRQYFDGHKGPYKVFIRIFLQDIKHFEFNKDIRKQWMD